MMGHIGLKGISCGNTSLLWQCKPALDVGGAAPWGRSCESQNWPKNLWPRRGDDVVLSDANYQFAPIYVELLNVCVSAGIILQFMPIFFIILA